MKRTDHGQHPDHDPRTGPGRGADLERLFREMASRYVEMEGAGLLREKEELEKQGAAFPTPGLDKKVLGVIRARRRMRTVQGLALAAACFALLLLIPRIMGLNDGFQPPSSAAAESAAAPEYAADEGPAATEQPEYELIPLNFDLPENFTVSAALQDHGQSIYYLDNAALDDVVLSLEITGEQNPFGGLMEIDIGGRTAYGESTADFSLLRFEKDEILYTLTCRHDINTLTALGRQILL